MEPVFGQIKEVHGCDGFMRRGYSACLSEWRVICTTHNLLKLWRHFLSKCSRRRELLNSRAFELSLAT